MVGVAVLVGIVVAGGALGVWLAASNGIDGVDDIVGAPLFGILLVGFAVFVGWSFFDPGIPIPRSAGWSAAVSGAAGGLLALLAGWSPAEVVFAALGLAFLVGCWIWSASGIVAEARRRKAGELPPVGAPLAVARTQVASNQRRLAARVVDFLVVFLVACAVQRLWPGRDRDGLFKASFWWVLGTFVVYEVASVAWGGSPAKRLCQLRIVRLAGDDARWPRVGFVRAMVRTLLVPLAVLNAIIMKLDVNVVHRLGARLDLLEGSGAGTVVMPKDEVARLRTLEPSEREAVLGELELELRQRPISVSRKHLMISLIAFAAGVALLVATEVAEPDPTLPSVQTVPTFPFPAFPLPTFPLPTFPVPTFPLPALPSMPTSSVPVGAEQRLSWKSERFESGIVGVDR